MIAGMTGGGLLRILPLFIAEISESHMRGRFSSYSPLAYNLGMLYMFVIGTYLKFHWIPFVMMPFHAIYFCALIFLPETPQHYIRKNDFEKAFQSLKFYRSCGQNEARIEKTKVEFEEMKLAVSGSKKDPVELKDFCNNIA
jgi:MFS family permease